MVLDSTTLHYSHAYLTEALEKEYGCIRANTGRAVCQRGTQRERLEDEAEENYSLFHKILQAVTPPLFSLDFD